MYKISTFLLKQIIFCIPIKLSIEKYWIIQQDFLKFYMKQHKTNSLWRTQIFSCSWNPLHWLHIKILRDFYTEKNIEVFLQFLHTICPMNRSAKSTAAVNTDLLLVGNSSLSVSAIIGWKNKTYNKTKRKNKKVLRNLNLVSSKKNFQS